MSSLSRNIASVAYTAFLFTKSDIKTTVIPISPFAISASPITDIWRLPHVVFWIWLHVFQFDVSNQTIDPHEDALNKRDRPLPAGRITLHNAIVLRWVLVPVCFALSACYSIETIYASAAIFVFTVIYNEFNASASHWIVRHLAVALDFASFEVGATLVGGSDRHTLDWIGALSVCISGGIIATTYQVQDFKDEAGDRATGRRTIPIIFPSFARWTVIMPLLSWSSGIALAWKLDAVTATAFVSLAIYIGARFLLLKSVREDQVSFYWYNLWLSVVHAFPGYYRLFRA
ncbi:UbiA prenyltransferase family [Amylostereum chailletii]|nr:UbiA prenyltransferase family [Amylostereum chailletii]